MSSGGHGFGVKQRDADIIATGSPKKEVPAMWSHNLIKLFKNINLFLKRINEMDVQVKGGIDRVAGWCARPNERCGVFDRVWRPGVIGLICGETFLKVSDNGSFSADPAESAI